MLLPFLTLYVWYLSSVSAQRKFHFTAEQFRKMDEFKHYMCGLTNDIHITRTPPGLYGWACVEEAQCANKEDHTLEIDKDKKSKLPCDALRYIEGRDTCCLLEHLWNKTELGPTEGYDWDIFSYNRDVKQTHELAGLELYKTSYFVELLSEPEEVTSSQAMKDYEICGVLPVGKDNGRTTYALYVCVSEHQCNGTKYDNVDVDIKFPFGNRFCVRSFLRDLPVCCHVSTTFTKKLSSWKFMELLPAQKYAPGFRSTFMCEQYQRLVCEGKADRCGQRVLYRYDKTIPGEFPHHALVGIAEPKRQTFHCHGAIISKQFVLSSYDCRMKDSTPANIVLVGYLDFESDQEVSDTTQITYIRNQMSLKEKHWFLLLRLWRPLRMSPAIRPACIDWFTYNADVDSQEFNFEEGWVLTYGPQTTDGKFSNNVTRYTYNFKSFKSLDAEEQKECFFRVPDALKPSFPRSWAGMHNHICVKDGNVYSPYYDDTRNVDLSQLTHLGYLSHGAPFSTYDRYCQFSVYGVYIQNERFLRDPPLFFETVPHALAWMEEIVWGDFSLLSVNLSWPECADWEDEEYNRRKGDPEKAFHQLNFRTKDYLFISPKRNEFYQHP